MSAGESPGETSLRCRAWRLRTRTLDFSRVPALMGIVNVTPDSFSDGGQYFYLQAAIDHALRLEDDGADILDIGGESTRPYSTPVAEDDELRRVMPVIEALVGRVACPISIDTSKSRVAAAALAAGVEILNDVTGLCGDEAMPGIAAEYQPGVCAMHMLGSPQTMQDDPRYENVVAEIRDYLLHRQRSLVNAGVLLERICLDPGIGFGKTHEHNIELVRHCGEFIGLGRPILVGHSRKGFIGKLISDKERDRTMGTLGVSLAVAAQGVQVLRVHEIAATRDALLCFAAVGGCDAIRPPVEHLD